MLISRTLPWVLIGAVALAACDLKRQPTDVSSHPITQLVVRPDSVALDPQQTQTFQAIGVTTAGDTVPATVSWTATGGAITPGGLFTADASNNDGTVTATLTSDQVTGSGKVKKRRLVQIFVMPANANVQAGNTQQFRAYGRRNTGDSVSVNVSYSATGGTITAGGLYTAGSTPGTFRVIAQEPTVSLMDTSAVAVTSAPPPPPGSPGTVSNLAVSSVTDSSVTLSFTEVTDGTGQPASYDVRWAAGGISWGSATEVTRGTCATPVAGSAIAATKTCTVQGLAGGTGYQFQLAAFRGTLNVDAVFGGVSNAASGTTSSSTAPVASVTVAPATANIFVAGSQPFTATLRDASGNVLTGRTIAWATSDLLLATVNAAGLVSGLAVGNVTITATSEGKSGTATLTVSLAPPPPPPGTWPNEPAGFTVVTDEAFNALVENGWHQAQRQTTNGSGLFLRTDLTAPLSLSTVLEFKYATGYTGGSEPGVEYYNPSTPVKESYFSFWWKPSNPWQNHPGSNVNKLAFMFPASGGPIYIMMFQEGGSYLINVEPEFSGDVRRLAPNRTGTPVVLGAWHRVEWYVKYSTTGSSRDGVTRWWLDGVLQGEYTDLQTPGDAGFSEYQLAPTWGGIGGTKTETDYYRFDHARISRQ